MPTALDAVMVLLLTVSYWLLINSLNILQVAKTILTFPVLIFLGIFMIYAIRHREDVSY